MGGWSIDPEPPSMYVLDEYVCLLMNKWIKVVQSSTDDLAELFAHPEAAPSNFN